MRSLYYAIHYTMVALPALLVLLAPASSALACECPLEDQSVKAAYEEATIVFVGTAGPLRANYFGNQVAATVFYAKDTIKGHTNQETPIAYIQDGKDCDLTFWEGKDYLVYAVMEEDYHLYRATICSRTNLASLAQDEIAELKELDRPVNRIPWDKLEAIKREMQAQ